MLPVFSMCAYYPDRLHRIEPRNDDLWAAYKFCRAIKTNTINMYLRLPPALGGGKINENNVGVARVKFGQFISQILASEGLNGATLVPVPSKDSATEDNFRSLAMVRQALGVLRARQIVPALRYNTVLAKAAEGGPRFVDELRPYVNCSASIDGQTVVIIDDIKTSGSSLLLSKEKIEEAGGSVACAIVCGRTSESRDNPWVAVREELREPLDLLSDLDF